MKTKRFKIISMITLLTVLGMLFATPAAAAAATKNETVYGMLNADGSVNEIYVVNQLIGDYIDYGEYTNIKNLSTLTQPTIDNDKIIFPDDSIEGGLFYQGTITGELPMVFDITYALNGKSVRADSLAGANGHLEIQIAYDINEQCDEKVSEGFIAQIAFALDLASSDNIDAHDGTEIVVGNTMNINYTILPEESGRVILAADVSNFEMDPISITLLRGAFTSFDDSIQEFQTGFDDMLSGTDDMLDGSSDLKDGITTLRGGVGDLSYGLSKLKKSGVTFLEGMDDYSDGLQEYLSGIKSISSASSSIKSGLDELSNNGDGVTGGMQAIDGGISTLASSTGDLKALAQSLLENPDPSVQALAQGTIQTLDSLGELSSGLSTASQGVADYTAGVQQTAGEYHAFDEGVQSLAQQADQIDQGFNGIKDGFVSYLDGVKSSASGTYRLYKSIEDLPDNVQQLIDGQIEFKEGIVDAKDDMTSQTQSISTTDTPAVSFASPDKNHPDSVQYILTTPGISVQKQEDITSADDADEDFLHALPIYSHD